MTDPRFLVGSALLILSAVLALACVVAQALLARWWKTGAGRHVFAFQGVLAAVLVLWTLRVWFPDIEWIIAARMIAFACVPLVLSWRLAIILRTWRAQRRKHTEEG
ncbi:hypothetical protein [Nonomuraea sp. NPDC050310]|uniref:putative phage holin n=1 Tax=Nonomuraea sp. NPDC050310 TaxID=3154935 RepID=UPI0033D0C1C5